LRPVSEYLYLVANKKAGKLFDLFLTQSRSRYTNQAEMHPELIFFPEEVCKQI
jgi:hypothetical protein